MDEHVEKFLLKVLVNVDLKDKDKIVEGCINRAYRDMLTGGRYVIGKLDANQLEDIRRIFIKHNYEFDRLMIDEVALIIMPNEKEMIKDKRTVTSFGLAQKIVNMTYKYFYVFKDYLNKNIDFSKCDCPLDSIILEKIKKNHTSVWFFL